MKNSKEKNIEGSIFTRLQFDSFAPRFFIFRCTVYSVAFASIIFGLAGCILQKEKLDECKKFTDEHFYYYTIVDNYGTPAERLDSIVTRNEKVEFVSLVYCKDFRCTENVSTFEHKKTNLGNDSWYRRTMHILSCN